MFKRISLALATITLIAGCSSGVKLNDVPVEDKGGASGMTGGDGANSRGTGSSTVPSVNLGASAAQGQGPVGVERVVYFDYDSYVIKAEFQSLIEAHSRFLKANTGRKIVVEGHTDQSGGSEYNLALGQKRSEAVRRSLGLLGVSDSQMESVSFGKEKPAMTGADESSMAKNRRAEISYR